MICIHEKDGDEMNLMLILDQEIYNSLSRLAPHFSSFDVTTPRTLSTNLKLPVPVAATIDSWLSSD